MKKVKVDLQCPYCGLCKTLRTVKNRKGITCPGCRQSIFLERATGVEGETDRHGYYFHAYEPINLRGINKEFKDIFSDEVDKTQTISLSKQRRGGYKCKR